MSDDDRQPLFFAELSLFTFAMLSLVTADNFVQLFFGWEGVGLASYLLIGFWYHRPAANQAAIKAFVVNRVGDFGFALGIFAIWYIFRDVNFDTIFAAAKEKQSVMMPVFGYQVDALTVICLLLFMGAMGKSAQFLLHTWLPDAMEGPTPVSALIHAATMVTAGVFMVARLSPLFELSPCRADGRHRHRRHHGLLCGHRWRRPERHQARRRLLDLFPARLHVRRARPGRLCGRHLPSVHACLLQGAVVPGRGFGDPCAPRRAGFAAYGRPSGAIPFTFAMMVIGTLSLTGFPFTSGFFSKDAIIDVAWTSQMRRSPNYAYYLLVIAAFLTSFYSWRLIFMAFFGKPKDEHAFEHAHESPPVMTGPLLSSPSGRLAQAPCSRPLHRTWLCGVLARLSLYLAGNNVLQASEEVELPLIKWLPTIMMAGGFLVAYVAYMRETWLPAWTVKNFKPIHAFLYNKWYFDELYHFIFVRPTAWLARILWIYGDGAIIDGLGPDGVSARVVAITKRAVRFQTGYVSQYAFVMLLGVAVIVSYFAYLFRGALFKI